MTTIMIYDQCGEAEISFYIVPGDYRHLDRVYVNGTSDESKVDELLILLDNTPKQDKFPEEAFGPDTHVIVVGFLP